MNTEKLYADQEFKNFRFLCEALGIEYKPSGKQRIAQRADVARYIKWDNPTGHKIVIREIYDTPFIKEDKRSQGNRSIYVPHAYPLILDFLVTRRESIEKGKIFFANEFFQAMGIINGDYLQKNSDQEKYARTNKKGIELLDLEKFFARTTSKNYRVLESTLNHMKKRGWISWEKRHDIQKERSKVEWETATEEEEKEIQILERDVRNEMGERDERQIRIHRRLEEYQAKVKAAVAQKYGWARTRNGYLIQLDGSKPESPQKLLLNKAELSQHRHILNDLIIEFTNWKAQKKYDKKVSDYNATTWGKPSKLTNPYLKNYENDYEKQILMADLFIRLPPNKR